jgi:UPF0042 nucleotide-binding protein
VTAAADPAARGRGAPDGVGRRPSELLAITGMSGAGRSTAADVVEDLGWFVVDNLPPALLGNLLDVVDVEHEGQRLAVVADVRSPNFPANLSAALTRAEAAGVRTRLLFLEADDDALVRRFEGVRRPHPLQGDGRLVDGIDRERALLADLRGAADVVLDTSHLNVNQLAATLRHAFATSDSDVLRVTVVSFGFKYGLPIDADVVTDARFLPNPHWIPALRPRPGTDPEVAAYVLAQAGAAELLDTAERLVRLTAPGYLREGKHYATVAVGCTGGRHRSVALTEQLTRRLAAAGMRTRVVHRDLGRE